MFKPKQMCFNCLCRTFNWAWVTWVLYRIVYKKVRFVSLFLTML